MTNDPTTPVCPRWLHWLAVGTVLFTLPLLFLGAGVTSHGVGMVDPQGFRPPWKIVEGLIENSGFDWRLEYGHRTFGFLVGICAILLVLGTWFFDRRIWIGWMSVLALSLICAQGLLGIFRVDYNALYGKQYAMMHGMFAQVVFAVLVSMALFTSKRWLTGSADATSPALKRWSVVTASLVFAQLLFGALVRHQDSIIGPRAHVIGAFIVLGAIIWLLKLMKDAELASPEGSGRYLVPRVFLKVTIVAQILLGLESWLAKFYVPTADLPQLAPAPMHAEWIRTLHYLFGTLLFSTTVVITLLAYRKPALAANLATARPTQLEVAL
jgi:cytochrome c oxidase assembly protein subunit 15